MSSRTSSSLLAAASVAALAVSISACGSSSSSSSPSTTHSRTASASTSSTSSAPVTASGKSAPASRAGTSSVQSGPVYGELVAVNHSPTVNKPWAYSVKVTNAAGRPLSGTVAIEFTFGGEVVGHDTPPVHPVRNGLWHDTLEFPAQSEGEPLSVQAVVHTSAGSVTLDWPITVVK